MAKNRTKKCCYQSRYNNSYVTPAQYITELICEKNALNKHNDLPRKFWELPEWANMYKYQIKYANQLVKKFPHSAIVKALLDPRTKSVYSLANPILRPIIDEYQKKQPADISVIENRFTAETGSGYKEAVKPKNIISKLKDIDNAV